MHEDAQIRWKTQAWTSRDAVEGYAARIGDSAGHNLLKNEVEVRMFPRFVTGTDVLDVGIGTGRASLPLARAGYRVTGIDSSAEMLRKCRELAGGTPIELQTGDIAALPFPEHSFDTIMALNAFAHFPHWQQILTDWSRVLRPGGRLVFDVFSLDHDIAYARAVGRDDDYGVRTFAPADTNAFRLRLRMDVLAAFASEHDLRIVDVVPYGLFCGIAGNNRWVADTNLEGHAWYRFLSWTAADERFRNVLLFLEEAFVGRLPSTASWRCMIVLESGEAKEHNARWIARNAEYNDALRMGLTADALERFGNADVAQLRADLNEHLAHAPNLFGLARILLAGLPWNWSVRLEDFVDKRYRDVLERVLYAGQLDRAALEAASSLARDPQLAAPLTYAGVPLGEALAYDLMAPILDGCLHAFDTSLCAGVPE